jgi:putative transposase
MRLLDEQYTCTPFYGVERMTAWLRQQGYGINPKRVRRLLRLMGLEALYPKPRLSLSGDEERRYPYLLRGRAITGVNDVWSTEEVYLKDYQTVADAVRGLDGYFRFYNQERPHQALQYRTPAQVFGR